MSTLEHAVALAALLALAAGCAAQRSTEPPQAAYSGSKLALGSTPTAAELAPPPGGDPPSRWQAGRGEPAAYHPPSGELARWQDIEILADDATRGRRHVHAVEPRDAVEPPEAGDTDP